MGRVSRDLAIAKDNLGELDQVIVGSEDPREEMRRNLLKIARDFYVHICLDRETQVYTIK